VRADVIVIIRGLHPSQDQVPNGEELGRVLSEVADGFDKKVFGAPAQGTLDLFEQFRRLAVPVRSIIIVPGFSSHHYSLKQIVRLINSWSSSVSWAPTGLLE
jgi:hypothetical protein